MKTKMKSAGLVIAAVVLVAVSILGTMAYLTDQTEVVTNTFTVGNVAIDLDETKYPCVPGGEPCERVKANEYHLMPGKSYPKDPTVTVLEDSELSYVRILMTINQQANLDAFFANLGLEHFLNLDHTHWIEVGNVYDQQADTRVYEFRYYQPVAGGTGDTILDPLFTTVSVPDTLTNDQLAALMVPPALKIDLVAHAIQAEGFTSADLAWDAFDAAQP